MRGGEFGVTDTPGQPPCGEPVGGSPQNAGSCWVLTEPFGRIWMSFRSGTDRAGADLRNALRVRAHVLRSANGDDAG